MAIVKSAAEAYTDITEEVRALREGGNSVRGIAEALNRAGHTTRRGKAWNAMQVKRVLDRSV